MNILKSLPNWRPLHQIKGHSEAWKLFFFKFSRWINQNDSQWSKTVGRFVRTCSLPWFEGANWHLLQEYRQDCHQISCSSSNRWLRVFLKKKACLFRISAGFWLFVSQYNFFLKKLNFTATTDNSCFLLLLLLLEWMDNQGGQVFHILMNHINVSGSNWKNLIENSWNK